MIFGPRRNTPRRFEIRAVHKDGRKFPVELSISAVHQGEQIIVSAFVRDLTERRRAREDRDRLVAVEHELSVARSIQQSILHKTFPAFPGRTDFDIHAQMLPAREVGGDFYDFFLISPDKLGVVVGDVSGKGVPAAILMAATRAMLRAGAMQNNAPREVLARVNDLLCEATAPNMFVSALYGVYHTSSGLFVFSNGGHEKPVVLRANGDVHPVPTPTGVALGAMPGLDYPETETSLADGDLLVLITDGITEAMDEKRELFGMDRLLASLPGLAGVSPESLVSGVLSGVHQFTGGAVQNDDITILALRKELVKTPSR
jgi:sigma-B regulation protein RsbU (phosphoserine phosphatase)